MLGAGHRFRRPRGTGSVGDSVGEGQCCGIFSPQTSRYTLAFETLLSFAVVCCQLLSICAFKLCSQVVLSSCAIQWCYPMVLSICASDITFSCFWFSCCLHSGCARRPCLLYRLLTLCPAPTDPVPRSGP